MFTVYELIDPRDGLPFYVGCSGRFGSRKREHRHDPASAAYRRCYEIRRAGLEYEARVVAEFADKIDAKKLERRMILKGKGLTNSKNPKGMLSMTLYPD